MIAAAHWRRNGPAGREPIAAPGDGVSLSATYAPPQPHWGKITSRPPARLSRAEIELVAFRLGCSLAAARRAIELGLV